MFCTGYFIVMIQSLNIQICIPGNKYDVYRYIFTRIYNTYTISIHKMLYKNLTNSVNNDKKCI